MIDVIKLIAVIKVGVFSSKLNQRKDELTFFLF